MDRAQRHLAAFDGGQDRLEKERIILAAVADDLALLRLLERDFRECIRFELREPLDPPAHVRRDKQPDFNGEGFAHVHWSSWDLAFHEGHCAGLLRGVLARVQNAQHDRLRFVALSFHLDWNCWDRDFAKFCGRNEVTVGDADR